ncbi:MAG: hypothetical protein EA370_00040 [Wenzhouxiangella sp.]|nr:MAG: hypothetical protein EA370_00040 [Wenzhouxiangella sp.]
MAKALPNPEQAVVDERKIRDYLLSPVHAVGRHKAQFFRALGYDLLTRQRNTYGIRCAAFAAHVRKRLRCAAPAVPAGH